jgi:hypothetical protein
MQDIVLVRRLISEITNGRPYVRDVFRDCYLAELAASAGQEAAPVSEKWINFYWQKLEKVPPQRLINSAASDEKLAALLVSVLGK